MKNRTENHDDKFLDEFNFDKLNDTLSQITPEEQLETDRKMLLAKKISTALKAKGLKQKDLAAQLDKKESEISKWLSGTHSFNDTTLWAISDALGIELININSYTSMDTFKEYSSKTVTVETRGTLIRRRGHKFHVSIKKQSSATRPLPGASWLGVVELPTSKKIPVDSNSFVKPGELYSYER